MNRKEPLDKNTSCGERWIVTTLEIDREGTGDTVDRTVLKSIALKGSRNVGMFPEEPEEKMDSALFCCLYISY